MIEVSKAQPALSQTSGSAMRLGWLPTVLCRWLLSEVRIDPDAVARLRDLARRGSLVYVMRYRSVVDYLLVAFMLSREGLALPEFVSSLAALFLRPLREIVAALWRGTHRRGLLRRGRTDPEARDRFQRLLRQGRPVLIFMRSRATGMGVLTGRRRAARRARPGSEYLREVLRSAESEAGELFLVPLAVLRGRGYRRKESRLATLVYSMRETPGDVTRLISLLWNARETSLNVGKEVALQEFRARYGNEGEERIVRRLARALLIFLHREERVVWGPTLLPKSQVRQMVLQGDDLVELVRQVAVAQQLPRSQVWRTAERYFDEIAANFHSSYFALLAYLFNRIWPRVFQGFEYEGLERVVDCVKEHPVVLVPCHRSHFDYLILSYIFYTNYLSPPHIAAGINLSFWPLGPLFRGAGAYFIRRTFEGNALYKLVFQNYLNFLIRDGYTQEFFIEGGRSRTGKILTPKLGMLSAIVRAFVDGVRRDLYLVPVSIHYGRIVEEEAYKRELVGAEKEKESLRSLLKARALLRQKYGTVYVAFAPPISLDQALGVRKEQWRVVRDDPAIEEEKRRFIQKLGFRLLREVNNVEVAGATSVSATVLLSAPRAALRRNDYVEGAQALASLLRHIGARFTSSLERNVKSGFVESIAFMESGGLVQRLPGEVDGVIHVPAEKRMNLDFYKNNSIHFFLLPALLAHALAIGRSGTGVKEEVLWWLDLFRWEFPLPERAGIDEDISRFVDYFQEQGVVTGAGQLQLEHPLARNLTGILENFREAYWLTAAVVSELEGKPVPQRTLIQGVRKRFEVYALLGEVQKPEGCSVVTLKNALSRYTEIGLLTPSPGRSRDRSVRPGPEFAEARRLAERLRPPFGQTLRSS